MAQESAIISLREWLNSPAGRYLLAWEKAQLDHSVADVFGFHALQLGLPELDALQANRMPYRWLASDGSSDSVTHAFDEAAEGSVLQRRAVALHCDFDALPFAAHSLDLVVLPHTLELSRDPHLTLREVERVLVPEGRVVIVGLNPASLWGLRQQLGRWNRRLTFNRHRGLFLPGQGEFINYWRLRDWLRLLSFEVEAGQFGCYRPPFGSERWLSHFGWMERAGERWWPVLGAVYFLVAVKRVRGMRLIGLRKGARAKAQSAPAVVANKHKVKDEACSE
ncbi:MAG: methyltransferase type 11 [Rhizobacter sp.]|nr:methyltransferase type 11 [Rhizobacter sp.]